LTELRGLLLREGEEPERKGGEKEEGRRGGRGSFTSSILL